MAFRLLKIEGAGMISRRYRVIGLSVWPGLPQIWAGHVAYGLILGLFFTVVFNVSVLSYWVYTDLLASGTRQMLWILSLTMYLAMAAWTVVWVWRFHPEKFAIEIERLYLLSGESYLQGRWTESRIQLEQVVAFNPSDTEALMRLARLLERTGQADQARRALDQCRDTPGSARWVWEIEQMAQRMSVKEKSESKQLA